MNSPTRRQHTVWRNYLRAWATKEQVWCGMPQKCFPANLMNVGQERDFYRIAEMTDEDVALVRAALVVPIRNQLLKELAEQWLQAFEQVRQMRRMLDGLAPGASSGLEKAFVEAEEKLQGAIEQNAIPLLERLLLAETFCLDEDSEYSAFMHFMMTQYFRTTRILGNMRRDMDERFLGTLDRSMGAIRHISATNVAWTLIAERSTMKPYLLTNRSGVALIAGDQPVINMLAVDIAADVMVEDCEFYYPLSPEKALVVSKSDRFASGLIADPQTAKEFNRLIAVSAERQIFAAKASDLEDVVSLVGRHVAMA